MEHHFSFDGLSHWRAESACRLICCYFTLTRKKAEPAEIGLAISIKRMPHYVKRLLNAPACSC